MIIIRALLVNTALDNNIVEERMRKIGKILVLIMTTFSCANGAALGEDHPSFSFEDLKEDSKFLKDVANTILSRPQDIQAMQEGMRKKHGVRSFELWRDCFDAKYVLFFSAASL